MWEGVHAEELSCEVVDEVTEKVEPLAIEAADEVIVKVEPLVMDEETEISVWWVTVVVVGVTEIVALQVVEAEHGEVEKDLIVHVLV